MKLEITAETSLQLPELLRMEVNGNRNHCRDLSTAAGALFRSLNGRLSAESQTTIKIVQ
jgi:hypothetical protein